MSSNHPDLKQKSSAKFTIGRMLAWTTAIAMGFGLAVAIVGHPLDYSSNDELVLAKFLAIAAGLTALLILFVERQFVFGGLLVILGLLFIALDPGNVRRPSNRNSCNANLRELVMGLMNYEAAFRRFPRAGTADDYPHSWRITILPYLDQQALYNRYRFNEPWDGPNNSQLAREMPAVFRCPSDRAATGPDRYKTSYLAVAGGGTVFPHVRAGKLSDATAGINETVILVEAPSLSVHWMQPDDITLDELIALLSAAEDKRPAFSHRNVTHAAFGDGSVRQLSVTQGPWQQLLAMKAAAAPGER